MSLDELKDKAADLAGKAQEFINRPDVKEKLEQAKEKAGDLKDKAEAFVHEKTHGKGILGFGDDK